MLKRFIKVVIFIPLVILLILGICLSPLAYIIYNNPDAFANKADSWLEW